MTPRYVQPAAPIPQSWPTGDAYAAIDSATAPKMTWQDLYREPQLQTLVETGLANNRDLRIAVADIAAARARYRVQRADSLPGLDIDAGIGVASGGDEGSTSFSADALVPSFEIDLFGRIAALTEAQRQLYFASEAGARAVRLTLIGDIGEAWLTYAADSSLLSIARETAANARRTVTLTRLRLEGGVAPRTDLRQAEQVLATAEADIARLTTALAQDINALELLVGTRVDRALLPSAIDAAAVTIGDVPAGLDSAVLLRRPDVVAAEFQLRSANASIGAARAALFPRISLTGLAGFASNALASLLSGDAFSASASLGGRYSIFAGGAARGGVELSEAERDAALADYERSIQIAFREVADALARNGTFAAEEQSVRQLVAAADDTLNLVDARYRGGIDPFLTRLDAQRSLYQAQRTLVTTVRDRAVNRITLYRAIGGNDF